VIIDESDGFLIFGRFSVASVVPVGFGWIWNQVVRLITLFFEY
jgi:hypothetical protein